MIALAVKHWRLIATLLLAVVIFTAIYRAGIKHERSVWQARMAAAEREAARRTQLLLEKNYAITATVTRVLERQRVVTRTIIERIDREVPAAACPVDGSFRVFHDAAARGEDPAPGSGTDAPAVPVKDAARTVADNYGACREDQARLIALQAWARSVTEGESR